jgi:hypothetical protein
MLSTGRIVRIGSTDNATPFRGGTVAQKRVSFRLMFSVYTSRWSSYSEQALPSRYASVGHQI